RCRSSAKGTHTPAPMRIGAGGVSFETPTQDESRARCRRPSRARIFLAKRQSGRSPLWRLVVVQLASVGFADRRARLLAEAEWASSREALAASEPRACRRSCPPGTPALKLAEVVERAGIRLLLATTLAARRKAT